MGKRIDISGRKIGCYTVLDKAQSKRTNCGAYIGYWRVSCECGSQKEMRADKLLSETYAPTNCGPDCELNWTTTACKCGAVKRVRVSNSIEWRCRKCAALVGASVVKGKPAHNRLPDGRGGFNLLLGRYKKAAKDRSIEFLLTIDEFRDLTKGDCHYCGSPPLKEIKSKKGDAETYLYNGVDRIDSGICYQLDNVVPCCSQCNYMKQETEYGEFMKKVMAIYEKHFK